MGAPSALLGPNSGCPERTYGASEEGHAHIGKVHYRGARLMRQSPRELLDATTAVARLSVEHQQHPREDNGRPSTPWPSETRQSPQKNAASGGVQYYVRAMVIFSPREHYANFL